MGAPLPSRRPVTVTFREKLEAAWHHTDSLVCVGLDPDLNKVPERFRQSATPLLDFNRAIVDATRQYAAAYKPQIAYYSAVGAEQELAETIAYIRQAAPKAVIILDAKRGDIGSTAEMYAREAFDRYQADAVTVNPYLGWDSIAPFVARPDRGGVVLCRTSNPSGGELQDLTEEGEPLYLRVARLASTAWNAHRNLLLVVGATWPEELGRVRQAAPELPFLVPGIGAQGGDLEQSVRRGMTPDGLGLLINSSRGIMYAGGGESAAIEGAARELRDQINAIRRRTP
jgi:orotidine-5'-phosphate decarboxylase